MNKAVFSYLSIFAFSITPFALHGEESTFSQHSDAINYAKEAYEKKEIAGIHIIPENLPVDATFDPKPVLNKLSVKIGHPFSQQAFDADLKMLSEEYDRVEPLLEIKDGKLYITLKVWPKPKIAAIKWHGNKHFSNSKLRKELGIESKTTFNRSEFVKAFNKLKEFYIKRGYFESQLQYTTSIDPQTNEITIDIHVEEGRAGKIGRIEFEGFTSDEKSALLTIINSSKYNFFIAFLTEKGIFNEDALEQDKLIILNFLQNEGYADAEVDIKVFQPEDSTKLTIQIKADKGPLYHFGKVTYNGNTLFTNAQLDPLFQVRPNTTFSPDKLNATSQAIRDYYGRKGYIEANVSYETDLVEDKPIYNVHFSIDEGQEYKVGMIKVFGNENTQSKVILRESKLIPGEKFDAAKLKATQERLEKIGYFKGVNVYAVRTQDSQLLGENYRDVFIEVTETTTGNLSLFFGYSSSNDVFGGLELAETNFHTAGLLDIFKEGPSALRGGGEYAHAKVNIGEKQRSYSLAWMNPYFKESPWRVGFDLSQATNHLQTKDYRTKTYGGTVFASYPLNLYWTYGLKYRANHTRTRVAQDAPVDEKEKAAQSGLISGLGTSLVFDSTNDPRKPTNGFRSTLESEFAGLWGNFVFIKGAYTNSYYSSLWSKGTMKYRYDFRFTFPICKTSSSDVPISERYFLGGDSTVRGYKPFNLGPHFSNGDPAGGISTSLLSVEYLQQIVRNIDAFTFIDAGFVSARRFRWGPYRMTWGFGLRLEVLSQAPIILGIGFPVNPSKQEKANQSPSDRFFISMGGQF